MTSDTPNPNTGTQNQSDGQPAPGSDPDSGAIRAKSEPATSNPNHIRANPPAMDRVGVVTVVGALHAGGEVGRTAAARGADLTSGNVLLP